MDHLVGTKSRKMERKLLFERERRLMVTGAINSARHHGINLKHGKPNPGEGDCAIESIIYNINERPCYIQKFPLSINYYRRIFVTDMANRTVDTDWNIYSRQKWLDDWREMLEPGIYERGIYGDLMLAGIACGVRKYLLIFNTNIDSPTNPIYAVDPRAFNVEPDSEIPVVLAYNSAHYESLHPCSDEDAQLTMNLVNDYFLGRCRYQRKDMQFLLTQAAQLTPNRLLNQSKESSSQMEESTSQEKLINAKINQNQTHVKEKTSIVKSSHETSTPAMKKQKPFTNKNLPEVKRKGNTEVTLSVGRSKNNESQKKPSKPKITSLQSQSGTGHCKESPKPLKKEEVNHNNKAEKVILSGNDEFEVGSLTYQLKGTTKQSTIQMTDDKMQCPFCNVLVKNIKLHFSRAAKCGNRINFHSFTKIYEDYQKKKNQERKRKNYLEQKKRDGEKLKKRNSEAVQKYTDKLKVENKELFDLNQLKIVIKYQEKAKEENKEQFARKNLNAVIKNQEKAKTENKEQFARKHLNAVIKNQEKAKTENKEQFARKNLNAVNRNQEKAKAENKEQFDANNLKAVVLCQEKLKAADEYQFNIQNKINVRKHREQKFANFTDIDRIRNFNRANIFGPIFICSCCKRRLFENGVSKITGDMKNKVNEKKDKLYESTILRETIVTIHINGHSSLSGSYICSTCKSSLLSGKIPAMAEVNGLNLSPVEEICQLTELENNLIALNINFQYIYFLKKSRWAATRKQMISVPVHQDTILNTVEKLPRLPRDAGLIPVSLKRKEEYKSSHRKELIDPEKIFQVLNHLKQSGHPYYQFYDDFNTYQKRCWTDDRDGHNLLFERDIVEENLVNEAQIEDITDVIDTLNTSNIESDDQVEEEEIDPIRKHQFDHNRNTCLTNNYPEAAVDKDGKVVRQLEELAFAPAEGNCPTNILEEKDWDIKSWPSLHPDGNFGLHHKRKIKLTDQQYFNQRILNADLRFSNSPSYKFGAAAYIERKQLNSRANISFMRGKKSLNDKGIPEYDLDDAFTTFEGVKNTPKYWQKVKYDMIAKLENNGPFHLFFTLSCGDTRYDENFSSFLVQNNYTMEYNCKDNGTTETIVKCKGQRKINKELNQFLKEDVSESLHELIRTNVITATRTFHHRVETFKKEIIFGKNNPMKVKHISYRVEFQGRGAAHIHGTLWLDLQEIEKDMQTAGNLNQAFLNLRHDVPLSDNEKAAISKFTDKFVTCSNNPNTVHRDAEVGARIVEKVNAVNTHRCTGPCSKYGGRCKYNFPRFPLKDTVVLDKNEVDSTLENNAEEKRKKRAFHQKLLSDVDQILKDETVVNTIMGLYEKGATMKEYDENRSKRIDTLLEIAGDYSYSDYVAAIKQSKKQGSTVLLKRDIDEIYVNNYNPEWLEAWNANLDIQPVLDYFAVITYVTDYWSKSDEELTQQLTEAANYLKSEPDKKQRCLQLANTFLTHRQMSEAEAYYKIFPNLTLKYSSIDTIFVPSEKRELRSRFLQKLNEDDSNFSKGIEVKGGREGIFLEKPDIVDKYCRRKIKASEPQLHDLSLMQFAKMYQPIRKKSALEYDSDDSSAESISSTECDKDMEKINHWKDDEDRLANFYITTDSKHDLKNLPSTIKLKNCCPGEINLWEKRSYPKAARIHKKKEDIDPHRYFFSELMLYKGFTNEDEIGANDEDLCIKLYLDYEEKIQMVKSHLLPFAKGIEEARQNVKAAMEEDDTRNNTIGNILDPEQEKENLECEEEEELIHPDFSHLNPDDLESEDNSQQVRKMTRNIKISSADERLEAARRLDRFQKQALHIALKYAQDVIIARKGKAPQPIPPFLMVHGGAGSGKSTLINVISQYVHNLLRRDGDDPDCPYVLLSAYTGTAAANIEGQTLHTLFSFNFGAGYMSLSDKSRDEKRSLYKNLQMLIIDEISLVDSDMLYKIDLRLREVTQKGVPMGNVAVIVLGDLMQMSPVTGRYIFLEPRDKQFVLANSIDPLWRKFACLNLEENHRQGEDKEYADMLNRIRVGKQTPEDIEILKERVRDRNHKDILEAKDALLIFGTNKKVNDNNEKRLKQLEGREYLIPAICYHRTIQNYQPTEGKAGEVNKTPFQKNLKLKIGAKVMLTYNIDTSDGLTNGARGELIGVQVDEKGAVRKLIIKFEKESIGQERRSKFPDIQKRYKGGTIIEKVKFSFSISKSKKNLINTATVIQFPVKLAFACTAHKVQGATVPKPQKVIICTSDSFTAAMIYVEISRVCALSQIYFLDAFDEDKMYPNPKALAELERLNSISMNMNPSEWDKPLIDVMKISSLNCRSLKKHFLDIISDDALLCSDLIALQETWLEDIKDQETRLEERRKLYIPDYQMHVVSCGKGKGIVTYFKNSTFNHIEDFKDVTFQLSKFKSVICDVINLYRSQNGDFTKLRDQLSTMIDKEKPTLLIGDFNFCYHSSSAKLLKDFFKSKQFKQLIKEPTHIDGNIIDQAYLKDCKDGLRTKNFIHSKYFSDHRGINIIIKQGDINMN